MRGRAAALWIAPHGAVESARSFQRLRSGGLGWARSIRLAASTQARNALSNTRLGLLPARDLDQLDVVIDVGANVGDWTAGLLKIARPKRVIALEPNPQVAPQLRDHFSRDPRVEVIGSAAGSHDGTVEFNVTAHTHNASVLRVRTEMSDVLSGGGTVTGTVLVPSVTLDKLLLGVSEVSLIKIDVQGYERDVLAGASSVLQRTRWVLLEANFVSHYEGDALLPELHQIMTERGFSLANLSEPLVARGQALFSDALYRREVAGVPVHSPVSQG